MNYTLRIQILFSLILLKVDIVAIINQLLTMDPAIYRLGFFMISGFPYLTRIVKSSLTNPELCAPIQDFIKQSAGFGIIILVNNEFINMSYKDTFICRVNVNDFP